MIKERNYGIDFFRILSSIMVVFLHTVGQGGILGAAGNLTIKGEVLYFIQIMCFCAVNSFALISGYVGIKTKHKYTSIISLWIQVAFYNVGVSAIKMAINLMNDKPIDLIMLLKSFFPVISEQNWYFTSYFCLFFFMPVLNHIVNTLSREKLRQNIFITIILFSIIETITSIKNWGINVGYSFLWLAVLYLIGAYVSKYDSFSKMTKAKSIIGFIGCSLITFLSRIAIQIVTLKLTGSPTHGTKFITYVSPFMILSSLFLLALFSKIQFGSIGTAVVKWLSPMTFGVFILHTQRIIYAEMQGKFAFVVEYNAFLCVLMTIGITIGIYAICSVIDYLRILLFKLVRVKNISSTVEKILKKVYCKIMKIGSKK